MGARQPNPRQRNRPICLWFRRSKVSPIKQNQGRVRPSRKPASIAVEVQSSKWQREPDFRRKAGFRPPKLPCRGRNVVDLIAGRRLTLFTFVARIAFLASDL